MDEEERSIDLRRLVSSQLGVHIDQEEIILGGGSDTGIQNGRDAPEKGAAASIDYACGEYFRRAAVEAMTGDTWPDFPTGGLFIFPPESFNELLERIPRGAHSFLISRRIPDDIRKIRDDPLTHILWITSLRKEGEMCIDGRNMSRIGNVLDHFLKEDSRGLLVIEAFEYLALQSGFVSALRWLHGIVDRVRLLEGALFLVVDPTCFPVAEARLLKREFTVVDDLGALFPEGAGECGPDPE